MFNQLLKLVVPFVLIFLIVNHVINNRLLGMFLGPRLLGQLHVRLAALPGYLRLVLLFFLGDLRLALFLMYLFLLGNFFFFLLLFDIDALCKLSRCCFF